MDNTVGSLTQYQKSIIIGTLLGDGYVRKIQGRKDAFLEINHSLKQKEYVDWKYRHLKNIVRTEPKPRSGNGKRMAYRFFSRQMPELTRFMELFYENKKKVIPDITLDPIMLTVWFMDDGSRCRESDVYLNTQQFSIENQGKLIRLLGDFGLQAKLNKDKEYYRIRFLKTSIKRLQEIIAPHLIPSMKYKIGL